MKKTLIVILVLFISIVVVSTAAYNSISADRTATINVVGDGSALLALATTSEYAQLTDGKLEIDFDQVTATGINMDATTVCDDVFTITNNSGNTISVVLAKTGTNSSAISFGTIEAGVSILSGASTSVSFTIDSSSLASGAQVVSSITLTATIVQI